MTTASVDRVQPEPVADEVPVERFAADSDDRVAGVDCDRRDPEMADHGHGASESTSLEQELQARLDATEDALERLWLRQELLDLYSQLAVDADHGARPAAWV